VLDRKYGRTITITDWAALSEKSAADLSDDDLVIIENFGGLQSAADARARRTLACNPPAPPTPAPVETKAIAEPETVPDDEKLSLVAYLEKHSDQPILAMHLAPIVDGLQQAWDAMNERNKERNVKIAALEQEVAALKAVALKAPTGPWEAGKSYAKHDTVQRGGGLWMCCADHLAGEAFSHPHWRLIVKPGKDARDLLR
jgi:hypothetical protein